MFFLSDDPLFSDEELLLMCAASGGKTVEDTATGNPLVFTTDIAKPLKSLLIPFTPIQQGTGDPSPSNIRNIVPWNGLTVWNGGKNLFDASSAVRRDGYILDDQGQESTSGVSGYINSITPVKPSTKYTFSGIVSYNGYLWRLYFYDKDGLFISRSDAIDGFTIGNIYTFTTPANCYGISFQYTREFVNLSTIMLEVGQTATAYEPYHPITETDIVFPSAVYGGTLDVVSGVLGNGWIPFVFDDQTVFNTGVYDTTRDLIGAQINELPSTSQDVWVDACCDKLVRRTNANEEYCFVIAGNGRKYFQIFCGRVSDHPEITTKDEAKAFVSNWLQNNPVTLVYSIATPQEIQLTPQQLTALVGDNTIWSDADGSMTAVYLKKG